MSQKMYNFVCTPTNNFDLDNNPYSCIRGTLNFAYKWARNLAKVNSGYKRIEFKAENGRKIYSI